MLWVALAEAGVIVLLVSLGFTHVRVLERRHGRREDQLLNQLLHVVGRPWVEAPVQELERAANGRNKRVVLSTASPEQLPD